MSKSPFLFTAEASEEYDVMLFRKATPADHAAFHPKCGSCGHCKLSPSGFDYCANEQSKLTHWAYVNPSTDYCPNHSELHVSQEGGEG